jgi:diguanylate cyclase (GGDEF)-like protein
MRWLAWATVFGGSAIGTVDVVRGMNTVAAVEYSFVVLALILIPIFRRTRYLRVWSLALLVPFFTLILYVLSLPEDLLGTDLMWLQTIPVISYLALGRRWGLVCSLVFVSMGIVLYMQRLQGMDTATNIASFFNLVVCTTAIMVFAHIYERNRENEEQRLLELAGTDSLTGLANRMQLEQDFRRLRGAAKRHKLPMSVAVLDLDHFKQINDNYGHDVGDLALIHAADIFSARARESDLLARLGGEEFVIVMINCEKQDCIKQVDALRRRFVASPLQVEDETIPLTFSAGVSIYGDEGEDFDALVKVADQRLYQAKAQGRNCVVG